MTRKFIGRSALAALLTCAIACVAVPRARADDYEMSDVHGTDKIGEMSVSDFLLAPTFDLLEPRTGSFSLTDSYLGGEWKLDRLLSGTIKLGTLDLMGAPAWYGPAAQPNQIGVVEGYGQIDSLYGLLRVGFVPISFGLEGGGNEPRMLFPRSLLFQYRYVNIRDLGISYRILNEGFFSDWAAFNGEGGADLDNEAWFTVRVGWQGGNFLRTGFSGTTGRTTPASTNPNGAYTGTQQQATLLGMGLDITQESQIRIGNYFLDWEISRVNLEMELDAGDIIQDSGVAKMRAGHFDVQWNLGMLNPNLTLLARYDTLSQNVTAGVPRITQSSVGVAWMSHYENSVLSVIGTRQDIEGLPDGTHQLMIVWRLSPEVVNFRSLL